jgi:cysteine dioxygenase
MPFQVYSIADFIKELAALPRAEFTLDGVYQFLKAHPIEPESLKPYLFFHSSHYTRNLIDKNDLYEIIAICWQSGQRSQIHNHRGQNCWMAVPLGKLLVQNYKVIAGRAEGGYCELAESDRYWMDPQNPGRVEPAEPIHYVANPAALGQRAVSIHLYSYPYNSCTVYFPHQNRSLEIPLHYSSEYGVLVREEAENVDESTPSS